MWSARSDLTYGQHCRSCWPDVDSESIGCIDNVDNNQQQKKQTLWWKDNSKHWTKKRHAVERQNPKHVVNDDGLTLISHILMFTAFWINLISHIATLICRLLILYCSVLMSHILMFTNACGRYNNSHILCWYYQRNDSHILLPILILSINVFTCPVNNNLDKTLQSKTIIDNITVNMFIHDIHVLIYSMLISWYQLSMSINTKYMIEITSIDSDLIDDHKHLDN